MKILRNVDPSKIHPNLNIKPNEAKIIVECQLRYNKDKYFSDGRKCANVSFREMFGFLFYNPPSIIKDNNYQSCYIGTAIFTPRDGLFSTALP